MTEFSNLPFEDQVALLAKRGHSKQYVADVTGFSIWKFKQIIAAMPHIQWRLPHETIEFLDCVRTLDYSHPKAIAAREKGRQVRGAMMPQVEFCGKTLNRNQMFKLWREYIDVSQKTYYTRLAQGWSLMDAMFKAPLDPTQASKLRRSKHPGYPTCRQVIRSRALEVDNG